MWDMVRMITPCKYDASDSMSAIRQHRDPSQNFGYPKLEIFSVYQPTERSSVPPTPHYVRRMVRYSNSPCIENPWTDEEIDETLYLSTPGTVICDGILLLKIDRKLSAVLRTCTRPLVRALLGNPCIGLAVLSQDSALTRQTAKPIRFG